MAGPGDATVASFPQTVYAVGLLYETDRQWHVVTAMFVEPGIDPLNRAEVIARGRAVAASSGEIPADYRFVGASTSKMVQARVAT